MGNDQAIEYNTILSQLEIVLERFKNATIDVSKYEKEIEAIKSTCEEELKEYDLHDSNNEFSGIIEAPFINAIGKLKRILSELKSNEIYVKIHVLASRIEDFTKSNNKDEEAFKIYRNSLISFLNSFKNSQTLPIHLEMNFIMQIYRAAYLLIQKEVEVFNESKTLTELSKDETHNANLNAYIVKKLNEMDLNAPENAGVRAKKQEIDMDGVIPSYTNLEFVKLLVLAEKNEKNITSEIKTSLKNVSTYKENLNSKLKSLNTNQNCLKATFGDIRKLKSTMHKNLALFLSSTALLIALPVGGYFISRHASKESIYGVREITYDASGKAIQDVINFYPEEEILTGYYIQNYTKYYGTINNYYYRFIELFPAHNSIDLSNLNEEDIYTMIREGEAIQTSHESTNSLEDLINKAYYEIINYNQLDGVTKDKTNWLKFSVYFALILLITILNEICMRKSFSEPDISTLFKALKKNRDLRERLVEIEKESNEKNAEIEEIESKISELVKLNQAKIVEAYEVVAKYGDDIRFTDLIKNLEAEASETKDFETRALKKD